MYPDNPNVTVKSLCISFQDCYKAKTVSNINITYIGYKFFIECCNYSFRKPRTDGFYCCCKSEFILKADNKDPRKIDYNLRQMRVKAYHKLKEE